MCYLFMLEKFNIEYCNVSNAYYYMTRETFQYSKTIEQAMTLIHIQVSLKTVGAGA